MKKSNTPNTGNFIVNFHKEKLKLAFVAVAACLFSVLIHSKDSFLCSDDDESKRPSTEEVDYTGYRDTSTGVRTPSDHRRGEDNEEAITKRIETTTDESMKEIEEILTAEEVLYTVKEGDTRSNILMENV